MHLQKNIHLIQGRKDRESVTVKTFKDSFGNEYSITKPIGKKKKPSGQHKYWRAWSNK